MQECGITKAEMKDKVEPLNSTVEKLREDVTYKIKVFDRIHSQVLESMEVCEELKMDISKCHTEIVQKRVRSYLIFLYLHLVRYLGSRKTNCRDGDTNTDPLQFVIQELKVEKKRLEEFIHDIEKTQKKTHTDYFILIERRNRVGLNLIDRNDELSILYEKANVQVSSNGCSQFSHSSFAYICLTFFPHPGRTSQIFRTGT